jgi:serine/threonine protein kinase/tetratricopeptide (TPR) repeat protein
MLTQEPTVPICPECGTRLEGGFSRGLGRCMICLLRVGFDDAEKPDETLFAPVTDRLGNYRIERREDGSLWELGRGAMGVTYRAVDTSLQRPVALKLIDSEWVKRGAEARERFMREARTAASLRHPNVATVYHFGIREENGQCFCTMELVEGETLEMRVRRTGPLDALTTIDIALQVSSALAAAEKQGLVHRDLKPANLMFVAAAPDANDSTPGKAEKADTVVKVIDFGVAKALVEKPDAMGLTHGGFVGTPAFASPEQFTDARVDVRSDIYSLGATLWYLLTGHRPFQGATIEQIRASQHSRALRIEQLKAARVPSRLVSLLVSMLAPEPAARPDVRALTSQLQDCRAQILDRWKAARRLALAAGLIGIASTAFVLFPRWHNRVMSQNAAPANVSEKSIAVLPFEDLSDDEANSNFAVGVQDEILTNLAKIADLKVISRTSIMQYKAGGKRNLRQIGQQLGVAHVLEGSVQRAGNRVRVNTQLIDVRTDAHLWAQTYDRDLADVFAIQSEIAKTIAQQLQAELSLQEKGAMEKPPTTDFVAYELYLRAHALVADTGSGMSMLPNSARNPQALRLLDEAVARDPHFVRAWCLLSGTHGWLYVQGDDHTPTRRDLAKTAVEAALRLQPDGGEPHLALAFYYYNCFRDFGRARSELAIASRTLPNDAVVFELSAYIDRREGRWEEATRNMERAVELDPRNLGHLAELMEMYHYQRRYADELRTYDRSLTIAPGDPDILFDRAKVALDWRADIKPYQTMQGTVIAEKIRADRPMQTYHPNYTLCLRSAAAATRILRNYPREGIVHGVNIPYSYWEGVVARWQGDSDMAHTAFTTARSEVEKAVDKQPDYPEALSLLGMIDAGLGRKEEALRQGRRACELVPITKDAYDAVNYAINLAQIYAWTGEKDLAIEQIEMVQRVPNPLSYGLLKLHPHWDSLRGDPRFEKIVASLAPK